MFQLSIGGFKLSPIAGDVQKLYYYIMRSIYYSTKDKYTLKCEKIFM